MLRGKKEEIWDSLVLIGLPRSSEVPSLEALLEKRIKAYRPNLTREELDRLKQRLWEKIRLNELRQATSDADDARTRLELSQTKFQETLAKRAKRNSRYEDIDGMLRQIASAQPKDHKEVFTTLDERSIRIPNADPFRSARGWVAGFKKNRPLAQAWLSKRWSDLNLPQFPRGPK